MAIICKSCGNDVPEGNQFCDRCGTPVSAGNNSGQDVQGGASAGINVPGANMSIKNVCGGAPQTSNPTMNAEQCLKVTSSNKGFISEHKILIIVAIVVLGAIGMFMGGKNDSKGGKQNNTVAATQNSSVKTNNGNKQNANAKMYYSRIVDFEKRMKQFADRINSGENKAELMANGNVLRDDITDEKNKLKKERDEDLKNTVSRLYDLEIKRTNCMLRGLRGETSAYAEGGGYYDEFYVKYDKFKQNYGLR